jgi:hypothetical protein
MMMIMMSRMSPSDIAFPRESNCLAASLPRLDDPYEAERTRWWKVLNPEYSQKVDRAELFERRVG